MRLLPRLLALCTLIAVTGCSTEMDRAKSALERGKSSSAVWHYTIAIESGELKGYNLAAAYNNRALAREGMKNLDAALID